jgi:hypothetical protein
MVLLKTKNIKPILCDSIISDVYPKVMQSPTGPLVVDFFFKNLTEGIGNNVQDNIWSSVIEFEYTL